jgi:hypothetical protein
VLVLDESLSVRMRLSWSPVLLVWLLAQLPLVRQVL